MTTTIEYALLSANVYGNKNETTTAPDEIVRTTQNTLPVPDGWEIWGKIFLPDGFMATAYQRGNEIVISYAGTTDEDSLDWITGNVPAGTGAMLAPQVLDAARFYLDVRAANPGATISFTGHSLGGGLASLMAVYFDHPATVFDQAPFIKSADSLGIVRDLKVALTAAGYQIPQALEDYVALDPLSGAFLPSPSRLSRQGQVQQIYVTGEALSLAGTAMINFIAAMLGRISTEAWILGTGVGKISGSETAIDPQAKSILDWGPQLGGLVNGDPVALHSISLLTGFLQSTQFLETVQTHPELLPRLFAGLFENNPKSSEANLLDLLVQRQYRGEDSLTTLSSDVNKIDLGKGLTSRDDLSAYAGSAKKINVAAILVDAVLAGLYEQGKNRLPNELGFEAFKAVLQQETGGLTIDMEELGAKADKVTQQLTRLAKVLLGDDGWGISVSAQARWTVQSGSDALQISRNADGRSDAMLGYTGDDNLSGGDGNDALVGYSGSDALDGGTGNDELYGGEGSDVLTGGQGIDRLYGGAGNDTYRFSAGDGVDLIYDTDGRGRVVVDGSPLTGGKKVADGYWISDDKQFGFALVENGSGGHDLIISRGQSNNIHIRGWGNGQLGIKLDDAPADVDPPAIQVTGDQKPYVDDNGHYDYDNRSNVITTGEAQPGFADVIFGSSNKDKLSGLDGNDSLSGYGGNDYIEGGNGDDLLSGGTGQDHIQGGDGNDHIFGGGTYSGTRIKDPKEDPYQPPSNATIIGATWAVFPSEEVLDGEPTPLDTIAAAGGDIPSDEGDIIDAGAGDDHVDGGYGDDVIDGGDGKDNLRGGAGNDAIEGGAGDDDIIGDNWRFGILIGSISAEQHGNDVLSGGEGNDTLLGQGGSDELYGGAGDDKLWGDNSNLKDTPPEYAGQDYLDGGDGNDQLIGGAAEDELYGGSGNDKMSGDDSAEDLPGEHHGDDYLDGEEGDDELSGGGGTDVLLGGEGADLLFGDEQSDKLDAQYQGDDTIEGEAGDDYAEGGGGNDEIYGGTDNDRDDKLWGNNSKVYSGSCINTGKQKIAADNFLWKIAA